MASGDVSGQEESSLLPSDHRIPAFVDWLVAAAIALGGLGLLAGGSVLSILDRDLLAEGIESGEISIIVVERELTEAEMLDFTLDIVSWTGIGLLVTGLSLLAFAIWFAVVRSRSRREGGDHPATSGRVFAVYGAVTTAVLSFIPFSPVLGSGLAGYLEAATGGQTVRIGAISGFLSTAPALLILVFVTVGLYAGLAGVGEAALGLAVAVAMLFAVFFILAYGAGLGALGGFIGGRIADGRE